MDLIEKNEKDIIYNLHFLTLFLKTFNLQTTEKTVVSKSNKEKILELNQTARNDSVEINKRINVAERSSH